MIRWLFIPDDPLLRLVFAVVNGNCARETWMRAVTLVFTIWDDEDAR